MFSSAKLYIVVFHRYKGNRQRTERRFERITGARVLIPPGHLHTGKGMHWRSLKFVNNRGRVQQRLAYIFQTLIKITYWHLVYTKRKLVLNISVGLATRKIKCFIFLVQIGKSWIFVILLIWIFVNYTTTNFRNIHSMYIIL